MTDNIRPPFTSPSKNNHAWRRPSSSQNFIVTGRERDRGKGPVSSATVSAGSANATTTTTSNGGSPPTQNQTSLLSLKRRTLGGFLGGGGRTTVEPEPRRQSYKPASLGPEAAEGGHAVFPSLGGVGRRVAIKNPVGMGSSLTVGGGSIYGSLAGAKSRDSLLSMTTTTRRGPEVTRYTANGGDEFGGEGGGYPSPYLRPGGGLAGAGAGFHRSSPDLHPLQPQSQAQGVGFGTSNTGGPGGSPLRSFSGGLGGSVYSTIPGQQLPTPSNRSTMITSPYLSTSYHSLVVGGRGSESRRQSFTREEEYRHEGEEDEDEDEPPGSALRLDPGPIAPEWEEDSTITLSTSTSTIPGSQFETDQARARARSGSTSILDRPRPITPDPFGSRSSSPTTSTFFANRSVSETWYPEKEKENPRSTSPLPLPSPSPSPSSVVERPRPKTPDSVSVLDRPRPRTPDATFLLDRPPLGDMLAPPSPSPTLPLSPNSLFKAIPPESFRLSSNSSTNTIKDLRALDTPKSAPSEPPMVPSKSPSNHSGSGGTGSSSSSLGSGSFESSVAMTPQTSYSSTSSNKFQDMQFQIQRTEEPKGLLDVSFDLGGEDLFDLASTLGSFGAFDNAKREGEDVNIIEEEEEEQENEEDRIRTLSPPPLSRSRATSRSPSPRILDRRGGDFDGDLLEGSGLGEEGGGIVSPVNSDSPMSSPRLGMFGRRPLTPSFSDSGTRAGTGHGKRRKGSLASILSFVTGGGGEGGSIHSGKRMGGLGESSSDSLPTPSYTSSTNDSHSISNRSVHSNPNPNDHSTSSPTSPPNLPPLALAVEKSLPPTPGSDPYLPEEPSRVFDSRHRSESTSSLKQRIVNSLNGGASGGRSVDSSRPPSSMSMANNGRKSSDLLGEGTSEFGESGGTAMEKQGTITRSRKSLDNLLVRACFFFTLDSFCIVPLIRIPRSSHWRRRKSRESLPASETRRPPNRARRHSTSPLLKRCCPSLLSTRPHSLPFSLQTRSTRRSPPTRRGKPLPSTSRPASFGTVPT